MVFSITIEHAAPYLIAEGEDKIGLDRWIIDVPGYTFRRSVTHRDEDAYTLWC